MSCGGENRLYKSACRTPEIYIPAWHIVCKLGKGFCWQNGTLDHSLEAKGSTSFVGMLNHSLTLLVKAH